MSDNFTFVQAPKFKLAGSGCAATDTSITLQSMKLPDASTTITMANFGGVIGFGTLEPGTSREEQISFTGITQNSSGTATLTGVTRGLRFVAPYDSVSANKKAHAGGVTFVIANTAGFYDMITSKSNDETITGLWTFTQTPLGLNPGAVQDASTTVKGIGRISATPATTLGNPTITIASPGVVTLNSHGLTANDMVQFTTTGALPTGITASTTYYVISTGLTANTFQIAASQGGTAINTSGSQSGTHTLIRNTPIFVGNDDTRIPTTGQTAALAGDNTDIAVGSGNKYVTQTGLQKQVENYAVDSSGAANTITVTLSPVPTSYADGMPVRVKVVNATTGATVINVNALGNKTVKKYSAGAISDLTTNDILANQTVTLVYNSGLGFFILQGPGANAQTSTVGVSWFTSTFTQDISTTTTTTIAHGLGRTPIKVRIDGFLMVTASTQSWQHSSGIWVTGTQNCVYIANGVNTGVTAATGSVSGKVIHIANTGDNPANQAYIEGAVTVDSTNITITWTKTNSPAGTARFIIEAQ